MHSSEVVGGSLEQSKVLLVKLVTCLGSASGTLVVHKDKVVCQEMEVPLTNNPPVLVQLQPDEVSSRL